LTLERLNRKPEQVLLELRSHRCSVRHKSYSADWLHLDKVHRSRRELTGSSPVRSWM
jgi:hypothetical protein